MKLILSISPLISQLKKYARSDFWKDGLGGITVAIVLIPQAMAYALLAELPAIYGLYACIVPLIVYAVLGTSRYLSIGPVAITAILISSGLSTVVEPSSPDYIELVLFLGFAIGIVQVLMSFFKMGFLVTLISQPVITGFISAAAVIIIVSQLQTLLGIPKSTESSAFDTLITLWNQRSTTDVPTVTLGLISVTFLFLFKRWKPKFPASLVLIVLTSLLMYMAFPTFVSVGVIGHVPSGIAKWQSLHFPDYSTLTALFPTILTMTLIGYIGSVGVAKAMEDQKHDHNVNPNKELLALGISKILGAFFQAMPSSGSYSRSAINMDAGSRSQLASIIAAALVVISLLFLSSFLYFIPKTVLAALIIVSVLGLINYKAAIRLYQIKRKDFYVCVLTFGTTLLFGIENGILFGILLSFFFVQYYSVRPHNAELVNIPGTPYYRNTKRFPEAPTNPEYIIIRFDDQLYFGNTSFFKGTILSRINSRDQKPQFLILNMANVHDMDSTGIQTFEDLVKQLRDRNIQLLLTNIIGPVRDIMYRSRLIDKIGKAHFFMELPDAIEYIRNSEGASMYNPDVLQHNVKRSFLE